MITILADHNLEGDAALLWENVTRDGWAALVPMQLFFFADVGLPHNSDDRVVWRFVQERQLFLLTANRNMKGDDSLEQVTREELTTESLPVITISSRKKIVEQSYRQNCATRLVEIVLELEFYRGVPRLYIP